MRNEAMRRAALTLSLLMVAACEDAADGAYVNDDTSYANDTPSPSKDAGSSASGTRDSGAPSDQQTGDITASKVDAGAPIDSASPGFDLALRSGTAFQNYLADRQGRALYFFANDVPGSGSSACTDTCLEKWPVFDVKNASLGEGLAATDLGRFMRADGTWQTTFKGRPLYTFTKDTATSGVTGDGLGARWFVARDYTVFVAAKADVIPDAASVAATFMTNRAGRTVFVFKMDTRGNAGAAPTSACNDACLDAWPVWKAPSALTDLVLPSNMKSADFGLLQRTVSGASVQQLSYRGWPLYFHTPDDEPGETSGHMTGAWRAIDPVSFAQPATTSDAGTIGDAGTK